MTRIAAKLACGLFIALVLAGESARTQVSVGLQGPEQGVIRRQTWLIPAQDHVTQMRTMVIRPPGDGQTITWLNMTPTTNGSWRTGRS